MAEIYYAVEVETDTALSSVARGLTCGFFRWITGRPIYDGSDTDSTIPVGENSAFKIALSGSETIAVAFQSGQLYAAENSTFKVADTAPSVKMNFTILDGNDFTGGELATAKGSAIAEGDTFRVTNNGSGTEAVEYVGINTWYRGIISKDSMTNPSRSVDLEETGDYGTLSGFTFSIQNAIIAGTTVPFWKYLFDNNIYLANRTVRLFVVIDNVFYQIWTGIIDDNPYDETTYSFVCKSNFKAIHKDIPPNTFDVEEGDNEAVSGDPIPVCIGDIEYALVYGTLYKDPTYTDLVTYNVPKMKSICAQAVGYSSASVITLYTKNVLLKDGQLDGQYIFVANGGTTAGDSYGITEPDKEAGILIGHNYATYTATNYTEIEITDHIPAFILSSHGYSGTAGITDRWNFKIASFGVNEGIISNDELYSFSTKNNGTYKLNMYDNDIYVDISQIINTISLTNANVSLISPNINTSGQTYFYFPIKYEIKPWLYEATGSSAYIVDGGTAPQKYAQSLKIFDQDRSTAFKARDAEDVFVFCDINYLYNNIPYETSNMYLAFDYIADWKTTVNKSIRIELKAYDQYKRDIGKLWEYYEVNPVAQANYIPNQYYSVGNKTNGEPSIFRSFKSTFKLPDDVINNIKNKNYPYLHLNISVFGEVGHVFDIDIKQVGLFYEQEISFSQKNIYATVSGEKLSGGSPSNTVYNGLRLICENYDGINAADIDYGNLPTVRNDWYIGRQLTKRQNSMEYIRELCKQSFVAAFQNRKGQLAFSAWRENSDTPVVHDHTGINRDSITDWSLTSIDSVFNTFTINYSYNPGDDSYLSVYQIKDVDNPSATPSSDLAPLWDICAAAYDRYKTIKEYRTDLSFYNDRRRLLNEGESGVGLGVDGSAYKFLQNAVFWLTRQKRKVQYSLPISASSAVVDLCDPVAFRDTIYTNAAVDTDYLSGTISVIEFDIKNDTVVINTVLDPYDTIDDDFGDIIETGTQTDTITESGSQTDTYTENGI